MWVLALLEIMSVPQPDAARGIEWVAPAECPSADEVRRRASTLALAPVDALRGHAQVRRRADGGYALELAIDGRRELHEAGTCETLADLTALVIAVAADPVGAATTIEPRLVDDEALRLDPLGRPAPSSSRAMPLPASSRAAKRRRPWTPVLAVHGVAGIAQLPGLDAGLDLQLSIERRRFAVQAHAGWLFARRTPIPVQAPALAELAAANASLRACGIWSWTRVSALGCGGIELGAVVGRPRGVVEEQTEAALWVAVVASAGMRGWVHPRVGLELGADLVLALRRPAFALRDHTDDAVRAGVGGLRGWAGLAVRLGRTPGR